MSVSVEAIRSRRFDPIHSPSGCYRSPYRVPSTFDMGKPQATSGFPRSLGASSLPYLAVTDRLQPVDGCINVLRWSPHGEFLYSGADDCHIGIWRHSFGSAQLSPDLSQPDPGAGQGVEDTMRAVKFVRTDHTRNIFDLSLQPGSGGVTMASCGLDNCVCMTDLELGIGLRRYWCNNGLGGDPQSHSTMSMAYRVAWLPGHPDCCMVSTVNTLELVDTRSMKIVSHWEDTGLGRVSRGSHGITSFAFRPSSTKFVAALNQRHTLCEFDLRSLSSLSLVQGRTLDTLKIDKFYSGVSIDPTGAFIAASVNGGEKLRVFQEGRQHPFVAREHNHEETFLKHPVLFGERGRTLMAHGSDTGEAFFWELDARPLRMIDNDVHPRSQFVPLVNVVANVDSKVVNVVSPHPQFDDVPIAACSGIDNTIKIVRVPPLGSPAAHPYNNGNVVRSSRLPLPETLSPGGEPFQTAVVPYPVGLPSDRTPTPGDRSRVEFLLGVHIEFLFGLMFVHQELSNQLDTFSHLSSKKNALKNLKRHSDDYAERKYGFLKEMKEESVALIKKGHYFTAFLLIREILTVFAQVVLDIVHVYAQDSPDPLLEFKNLEAFKEFLLLMVSILSNEALCAAKLNAHRIVIRICEEVKFVTAGLKTYFSPARPKAFYRTAVAYQQLHDYDRALQQAEEARKVLAEHGQTDPAVDTLIQAIKQQRGADASKLRTAFRAMFS